MGGNDGDVVPKCIYRRLVDIQRIRPMVQFPGTLSKYASGILGNFIGEHEAQCPHYDNIDIVMGPDNFIRRLVPVR